MVINLYYRLQRLSCPVWLDPKTAVALWRKETAENGKVLTLIPLPLAGLMCDQSPEALLAQMEQFLADCRRMGFNHQNLLTFFTLMPLAVSPELKCTDRGLVDALHKRLLPLIDEIKEISSDGT